MGMACASYKRETLTETQYKVKTQFCFSTYMGVVLGDIAITDSISLSFNVIYEEGQLVSSTADGSWENIFHKFHLNNSINFACYLKFLVVG
jgi:hypothetical protein